MLFTRRNNASAAVGGAAYCDSCVAADSPVENIACVRCMSSFRSKDRRLIENVIACTSGEQCFSLSRTCFTVSNVFSDESSSPNSHNFPRLSASWQFSVAKQVRCFLVFMGLGPRGIDFALVAGQRRKTQREKTVPPNSCSLCFERVKLPPFFFFYFFSLISTLVLCLRTINNQCWQYCRSHPRSHAFVSVSWN